MSLNKVPKSVLIALAVVVTTGLAFGAYWYFNSNDSPGSFENEINYGPPTGTELDETQQHKESLGQGEQQDNNESPPDSQNDNKQKVVPVISFYGQNEGGDMEVNGYVSGVIEQGGKCTAALTFNGQSVSETKTALEDAQSTSCGLIVIPKSKLKSGEWELILSYSSSSSEGSSEPVMVVIQ